MIPSNSLSFGSRPLATSVSTRRRSSVSWLRIFLVLVGLLSSLGSVSLDAAPCFESRGHWPYGPTTSVDRVGSTLYFGAGSALMIASASDPANPVVLGEVDTGSPVWHIASDGNLAVVTDRWRTMKVIDVSVPTAPVVVGTYDTSSDSTYPYGVALSGGRAFLATRGFGLRVLDLSNPAAPVVVGSLAIPGVDFVFELDIVGDRLYLAANANGLRIVDISNPLAPTELGSYAAATQARDVFTSGSRVYVADGSNGVRILDALNPAAPILLGTVVVGHALHVGVMGSNLFVTDLVDGLHVVDLALPQPQIVGSLIGKAFDLEVLNGFVVMTEFSTGGPSRLRILDVSAPSTPMPISDISIGNYAKAVTAQGPYAYVATGYGGMAVVDMNAADGPTQVGRVVLPGDAVAIEVSGSYAYVVLSSTGLRVVDISTPNSPVEVANLVLPGFISYDLGRAGNLLYVSNHDGGVRIVDVSVPTAPTEVGSFLPSFGFVTFLAVSGNRAIFAGDTNLAVIDLSVPTAPVEVDTVMVPSTVFGVTIEGNRVYVADTVSGLRIWDITNPTAAVELGVFQPFPLTAKDVAVFGDRAYVAGDTFFGLLEVDVSNPMLPVQVGQFQTGGNASGVSVVGDRILLADWDGGVEILGCADLLMDGFESGDTSAWTVTLP